MGYLMPKLSLEKNSSGTIQPTAGKEKGVYTFPKGICLKVNKIRWLEIKLTMVSQPSTLATMSQGLPWKYFENHKDLKVIKVLNIFSPHSYIFYPLLNLFMFLVYNSDEFFFYCWKYIF